MKELITRKDEYIEYTNDLTRDMDNYLRYFSEYAQTYIYNGILGSKVWAIRYPGATRGHLEINEDDIIIDIVLYKDCNSHRIYKENVEECFKKYIGMKLIMI